MRDILHGTASPDYSRMKRMSAESLIPRKKPQQRRSRHTIEAVFEATIQVLLANGYEKVTTIQIAERAGVSVGSLYQYFPNKRALLAAIVRRHVGSVVDATVAACESSHGQPIEAMCATIMTAFVDAKTRRPDISRALYLPTAAINSDEIVRAESSRCAQAIHDMLITATNATFEDPRVVSRVVVGSIVGPTRAVIEAGGDQTAFDNLKAHLTALCVGYLKEVTVAKR